MDTGALLEYLDRHAITYQIAKHPPFFTCAEADAYDLPLRGLQTKNLFLRAACGQYFLVMTACEKRLDLKRLRLALGVDKLHFGSPDELQAVLGLTPGAVTVLALVNDPQQRVRLVVDAQYWPSEAYLLHPLVNTATVSLAHAALEQFLQSTGHAPLVAAM